MSTGPNRSWDDEGLRASIASERSWRGTARALGLNPLSAGTMRALKRRAADLHVDTSHFTAQRTWSDAQLREAVTAASSWSDVLRRLRLTDREDVRVRVKGHAVRLGIDASHLMPPPLPAPARWASADVALLSRGAERFASAWFSVRGAAVATPDQPAPYDLLVTSDGRIQRVQVKTTAFHRGYGSWTVNIGRRPYSLDKDRLEAAVRPGRTRLLLRD